MKLFGRDFSFGKSPILNEFQKREITETINAKLQADKGRLNAANKAIIDKIVSAYKDQSRKDIQKWRTALQMANHVDTPKRATLHDLYDDLSTDGHLLASVNLRKYSTLNTKFQVVDSVSGQTNDEATKFLNQKWFYDFLNYALESVFLGYTLVEFTAFFQNKCEISVVPRRNVVPEFKRVYPDLLKQQFIEYGDPYFQDWLIEIGNVKDFGIMNTIVPNLVWKRNVSQSWAEFCEKFGIPLLTAQTTSYDVKDIDKIEYMLKQLGEASVGVFPVGTTVDIKEANRTDAYQTYDNFIRFNREEISVAILGGTMVTNDGSSRSQSEVHERNLDEKIAVADKRTIIFLVNDTLIPLLRNQGYNFFSENSKFKFTESHNLSLDAFWNITKGIMESHEVDEEWLSETFFVPITGKKKSSTIINPVALGFIPEYNGMTACCSDHDIYASSEPFQSKMKSLHDQLASELWKNKDTLSSQAQRTAAESLELIRGLYEGWGNRAIEADWNAPDHLMLQMMEMNLFEFSSSKTEAKLAAMNQLLIDREKMQIRSFSDFKAEASKIEKDFNENWLRTEYNLSVATGQNSAAYARFMSEKDTVTSYVQYQTAGDNLVRPEHEALDGKIFSLNDKTAMSLWPPNGYGCRCEMLQYIGDTKGKVMSGDAGVKLMPSGFLDSQFNINRGDLKQVFTRKQFYTDKAGVINSLNDLHYKDVWGLQSVSEMKGLKNMKLDKTITGDNVRELFQKTGEKDKKPFMGFEDYLKRKLVLPDSYFEQHTIGKYLGPEELRHQLFPFVKDVLAQPDEVWLAKAEGGEKTYVMRYIKLYEYYPIVVEGVLGSATNIEVRTWYIMKNEELIRKGLLISQ